MSEIKTYEEMNKQICGLLRLAGDNVSLYAAKRIAELEAENDKLRARLENAVELPCKVGDTVYWLFGTMIYEYNVQGFTFNTNDRFGLRLILGEIEPSVMYYEDKKLFFDRSKAEAKLKELQGGVQK